MTPLKCTFKDIFGCVIEDGKTKIVLKDIEIPRIQRDYAQGRLKDDVNRIRDRFLNALLKAITGNNDIILDFIYGDVKDYTHPGEIFKRGLLTLLDGQQRLTTLFLLHWYIAKKENIDNNEYEFLNNFTYDTRFTSRDFCKKLICFSPDFNSEKISENIIDQPWYPYEWRSDPTIQSMLVMIDAIHDKLTNHDDFKNKKDLWASLVDNKKVSFYFLPVKDMGDPEELYIKLNSRGKSLTLFEQIKAEFEKNIKQLFSEEYTNDIYKKFDNTWADMLYPYKGSNKIIDDEFMRYFQFISDILWYQTQESYEPEKDAFKIIDSLFGKDCANANENIEYFEKSFDCWCGTNINSIDSFFTKYFCINSYETDKVKLFQSNINILKECFNDPRFPLTRKLLLYSINTYVQNRNIVSEAEFIKRIRIIRNLIENSENEILQKQMKPLLAESKEIILKENISKSETGSPGYNDFQKIEEREKIKWLENNPDMKDELYQTEDHKLLKGSVSIIGLENSGNFKKFRVLFENRDKHLIDRAMLSLGDYTQKKHDRFYTALNNNWDELFHHSNQRIGFDRTQNILNKLLESFSENDNIEDKLNSIIENYLNDKNTIKDWRYYFVKYHKYLNIDGDGNYIKGSNIYGYEIVKLNRYQLNGYNWNIYLYLLFKENTDKLILDNYYKNYSAKLQYKNNFIDCLHDQFIVYQGENTTAYKIDQENGIDTEDRVEKGRNILSSLGLS